MADTFGTHGTLGVGGEDYRIARFSKLEDAGFDVARLPYSLRVLLENLLRHEDDSTVPASDIEALASWDPKAEPSTEIAFRPARLSANALVSNQPVLTPVTSSAAQLCAVGAGGAGALPA